MSAAWKHSSHERWNRVVPIPYYSHLLIIAIIHLLFPCRSRCIQFRHDPRESTRLRKTGTIWKQNWHHCHCKQWNHMRLDSHWTFTQNTRAYTVLRMLLGAPMIMVPCEHHAYLQSTTKTNGLKGIYHKRHYWLEHLDWREYQRIG